ncbi:MAG: glutamate 5-kinase [Candidatus Margulisbacteria bacterium]|nr:glutamate 5-kinase [Candidatus Margulisiibacteriota bacterium]
MVNFKEKKLVVIKIGSNILTTKDKKPDLNNLRDLVHQISQIKKCNKNLVIVSSGAIAYGTEGLGMLPKSIQEKQAAAAIGQVVLMENYQNFFAREGIKIGQILLTKDALLDEHRAEFARNTFNTLLEKGIVPIVNENDTVAVEEIKFSDNDNLSSMVAVLLKADLQIFLSDIDGLYDLDPRVHEDAKKIKRLTKVSDEMIAQISASVSAVSRGGMKSKVQSAKYLLENHIDVIIANGRQPNILLDLYEGQECGTCFIGESADV